MEDACITVLSFGGIPGSASGTVAGDLRVDNLLHMLMVIIVQRNRTLLMCLLVLR